MGAIALILIDKGCCAAQKGDLGYTNRMQEHAYSRWFAALKRKHRMKHRQGKL